MKRSQAGFSFIEILVVMGIIVVLVGMVAVVVPRAQEASRQNTSIQRVRQMVIIMSDRNTRGDGWAPYSGKNFVLSLVANNDLDRRNSRQLEMLFSPGDRVYTLEKATSERYEEVTAKALKSGADFHELTSYAGRRNADRDFVVTPDDEQRIVPIICDDDDGNLHHPKGLVMGFTDGSATFVEWRKLDLVPPEDKRQPDRFLGDAAETDQLRAMSSE